MLTKDHLRPYQTFAVDHILHHPECGLFLDMGLGKTISTLTAIDEMLYAEQIDRVLIVAPKNVALTVWSGEIAKWKHVHHLKYSIVMGTPKQRKAALLKKADIYITSRDNIAWMVAYFGGVLPFDMLVIDELSSFKNQDSQRFQALKIARPDIKRVVGLTGTPASNGLIDLFAEIYLIDQGKRLGTSITEFRNTYFNPDKMKNHVVYSYRMKSAEHKKVLFDRIKDICISMRKEDYITLPKLINITIPVQLDDDVLDKYKQFEEEQVLEIVNNDIEIGAFTAAALYNKLLQFSNGAVYDSEHVYHVVHDHKLDALGELLEAAQAAGENVIVAYNFKSDLKRIQDKFGGVVYEGKKTDDLWNVGKIPLLLIHPAGAGHGLNLQFGGHVLIWFGQNWSLEFSQQTRDRLHRPGQRNDVRQYKLISQQTIDEEVIKRLKNKALDQDLVIDAVKAIIKKYAA